MQLYTFFNSSASYRVRIALALKGLTAEPVGINLRTGAHRSEDFLALNPSGQVPTLVDGETRLSQSLAIIDYLDAKFAASKLVSSDPAERSVTLAQALTIASEVHPLQNLRVLTYLRQDMGQDEPAVLAWLHRWMGDGLAALEAQAPVTGLFGGEVPNLADVCLVPQMYSVRRFGLSPNPYPRLVRIDAALCEIPAIAVAAPEAVKPG